MKILLITHSFPRFQGDPAGNFIYRLSRELSKQGVEFHIVAPASKGYPEYEEVDGLHIYRFRYAPRKYETLAYTGNMAQDVKTQWSARFALVGLLGSYFTETVRLRRRIKPDLIHAHWWFPAGLVGTWVSKLGGIPLLTTLHGSDIRLIQNATPAQSLARMVLNHSNKITTVSRWLSREVSRFSGQTPVVVAPMPVDPHQFPPSANGERQPNRVLFVGRLNKQKGADRAIEALAAMKSAAALDLVGDGPDRKELEVLAKKLGVDSQVKFHGHLSNGELPALYRAATVLVVPSADEGLGLVAVEAQLSETPVVAFESGGLPDIVQHDRTGLLVPPTAPPAHLARALDEIISNPTRAAELGKAGRLSALSGFAPESVAHKYREIYLELVEKKGEGKGS